MKLSKIKINLISSLCVGGGLALGAPSFAATGTAEIVAATKGTYQLRLVGPSAKAMIALLAKGVPKSDVLKGKKVTCFTEESACQFSVDKKGALSTTNEYDDSKALSHGKTWVQIDSSGRFARVNLTELVAKQIFWMLDRSTSLPVGMTRQGLDIRCTSGLEPSCVFFVTADGSVSVSAPK